MKILFVSCFYLLSVLGLSQAANKAESDFQRFLKGKKNKCMPQIYDDLPYISLPGDFRDALCPVFEMYAAWHCRTEACADTGAGVPDPSSVFTVFGTLFKDEKENECVGDKGFFCMLKPFHEYICPSETLSSKDAENIECSCDQNFEFVPEEDEDGCRALNLDDEKISDKTALVEYCEVLTDSTWIVDPKDAKEEMENACIQGCTRYIAAEGYGCCDVPCKDCGPADIECPDDLSCFPVNR